MIIVTVFVMFMFIGTSTAITADEFVNTRTTKEVSYNHDKALTSQSLNLDNADMHQIFEEFDNKESKQMVAIISLAETDNITNILLEWCIYNKYFYKIYTSLPSNEEIESFDLLIFGDIQLTSKDSDKLYGYADQGKTMIFTQLPSYEEINNSEKLADFYGIEKGISKNVLADGIRIFPDFMIAGERIYTKGDYFGNKDDTQIIVPHYKLAAGYDVYSVGLLDKQKELGLEDKDLPPLLWRTKTDDSFIFVINSEIYKDVSMLGVLTSFMSEAKEYYLYPIVNAQTISLINIPYLSDENQGAINQKYSRSSQALSRDILWPDIVQVLMNYGESYNFFLASQLDYSDHVEPDENNIDFYLNEINKLSGVMGLSLGQVSSMDIKEVVEKNNQFYKKYMPNYKFDALFIEDFEFEESTNIFENDLLKNISLVMSDYKAGDKLIDYVDDDILSIKYNLNGYQHETMDNLRMYCIENVLGMSNMKVDIKEVYFPEEGADEWNELLLEWSKGDTYFNDFSKFDMVSVYELEDRVRKFLALDFVYVYKNDEINVKISNLDEEAYFILTTHDKSIDFIQNAESIEITKDKYLIIAYDEDVQIKLKEKRYLDKPKNNKTIPSNPERSLRQEK